MALLLTLSEITCGLVGLTSPIQNRKLITQVEDLAAWPLVSSQAAQLALRVGFPIIERGAGTLVPLCLVGRNLRRERRNEDGVPW